jgi:hypothetical protein
MFILEGGHMRVKMTIEIIIEPTAPDGGSLSDRDCLVRVADLYMKIMDLDNDIESMRLRGTEEL